MTKTLFTYNPTLMSLRTAKYVEAMIREGDHFNYDEWLKRVREEEAQAKLIQATGSSGELAAIELGKAVSTPDDRHRQNSASALALKTIPLLKSLRPHRQAKSQSPKTGLGRWLQKVHCAWGDFQGSRARDAVYGYLEAVFAIVEHFRLRRRTSRLLRHAFDFADLPFDKNADPFSAVIRCTCGDAIDTKMISKWSIALRYVARSKAPKIGLVTFMKEMGGINACADRYARMLGSRGR
jgi:hypothetical protein